MSFRVMWLVLSILKEVKKAVSGASQGFILTIPKTRGGSDGRKG